MNFSDLYIKTDVSTDVKQASRAMYSAMKERDAIRLRRHVLQSLIETMAVQLADGEHKSTVEIDKTITEVVEGIIKDNRITREEGEQMKANAIRASRRNHQYRDLFLNIATSNVLQSVDKKSFVPEVQMAMESYVEHSAKVQTSVAHVMETAVFAAAEQVVVDYQKYFPKVFLDLIR